MNIPLNITGEANESPPPSDSANQVQPHAEPQDKNPNGRPSKFTQELSNQICDWISEGKSLAGFCREHSLGHSTVMRWLGENEKFRDDYTCARANSGDSDADIVTDIRERVMRGEIPPDVARVAIDAAKWSAGKRQPKKYGDKIEANVNHTGDVRIIIGGDI